MLAGGTPVLVHNARPCETDLADVWMSPNRTLADSFDAHFKKHAQPLGRTEVEYQADAKARIESNLARQRLNSSRVDLADGTKGVKCRTPVGGPGGIVKDGKLVTFWYDENL